MKHYCNAKTTKGTKCKMTVSAPGRRCPYHKYKHVAKPMKK